MGGIVRGRDNLQGTFCPTHAGQRVREVTLSGDEMERLTRLRVGPKGCSHSWELRCASL